MSEHDEQWGTASPGRAVDPARYPVFLGLVSMGGAHLLSWLGIRTDDDGNSTAA